MRPETSRVRWRTGLGTRCADVGERGRIDVSISTPTPCTGIVARFLLGLHRKHTLVYLRLQKLETPQQLSLLAERRIDAGFLRPPDRYPVGLTGIIIFRQPVVIALPEGHRLAERKRLRCSDLTEEAFVSPSVEAELAIG